MPLPTFKITEQRVECAQLPAEMSPLLAYWDEKRRGAPMPRRRDVDPVEFRGFLGRINLVEIQAPSERFIFRVLGTRFPPRPGGPRDGQGISIIRPAIYRDMFARQFGEGHTLCAPTLYANTFGFDGMSYSYVRLLLPLGEDRETADRLLLLSHGRYAEQDQFWAHWAQRQQPDRH
jgi:hypothetical protein